MFNALPVGEAISISSVLGQITERFREALKTQEREGIPIYQFDHKERKDDIANDFRRQREVRDGIVGVAQEEPHAFSGKTVDGRFEFERGKPVYVNHYYFTTFSPVWRRSADVQRHSRVYSSTTVKMRNRRPSASRSLTKSMLRRSFGRVAPDRGTRNCAVRILRFFVCTCSCSAR